MRKKLGEYKNRPIVYGNRHYKTELTQELLLQELKEEIGDFGGQEQPLEKNVLFCDYDGTILHSYTKDEFLGLNDLPPLPQQEGLICQGWNWDLQGAKSYVEKYGILEAGAYYATEDGKTRIHINLQDESHTIYLYVYYRNNPITIEWGDGNEETITKSGGYKHIYYSKGNYIIKVDSKEGTYSFGDGYTFDTASSIMGRRDSSGSLASRRSLFKIEIGNKCTANSRMFRNTSLQYITFPSSFNISQPVFYECTLKYLVIPNNISYTSIGGITTYGVSLPNKNLSLASIRFLGQSIVIPEEVSSCPNFTDNNRIKKLIIPDKITNQIICTNSSIEEVEANGITALTSKNFNMCRNLKSAKLTSVTNCGPNCFEECSNLETLYLPSVNTISTKCFYNCKNLTNLEISENITSLDSRAWYYAAYNRSVNKTCHYNIISLGESAFSDASYNYTVDLTNSSMTSIPRYCFSSSKLLSIVMPSTITSIGDNAFQYTKIDNIQIPDGVTSIGSSAFYYCTNLKNIYLPDTITDIGSSAFSNCINITSINLSSSLTSLGTACFRGCTGLKSIFIPKTITEIKTYTFDECPNLKLIDLSTHEAVPTLGGTFGGYYYTSKPTIIVPDALYDEWVAATNWSSYADTIVKASEYNN